MKTNGLAIWHWRRKKQAPDLAKFYISRRVIQWSRFYIGPLLLRL